MTALWAITSSRGDSAKLYPDGTKGKKQGLPVSPAQEKPTLTNTRIQGPLLQGSCCPLAWLAALNPSRAPCAFACTPQKILNLQPPTFNSQILARNPASPRWQLSKYFGGCLGESLRSRMGGRQRRRQEHLPGYEVFAESWAKSALCARL